MHDEYLERLLEAFQARLAQPGIQMRKPLLTHPHGTGANVKPPVAGPSRSPVAKPGMNPVAKAPVRQPPPSAIMRPAGTPPAGRQQRPRRQNANVNGTAKASNLMPEWRLYESGGHTGTMIALYLPPGIASKVALPDGEKPETMHITLAYLGKDLSDGQKKTVLEVVKRFAVEHRKIAATLGGVGRFSASNTSEGKDVVYLSVDSPDITKMRPQLVSALETAGVKTSSDHGFVPHCTLQYIDQSLPNPIIRIEPLKMEFSSIDVMIAESRTTFKLAGF